MTTLCESIPRDLIAFTGEDAGSFLHGQLTCDVEALPVGRSTYGAYCTPKGRMLATFLLWRSAQGYFMQLPAALRELMQKRLSMYVLRAKVKVVHPEPPGTLAGISGDDAAARIQRIFGGLPRDDHEVMSAGQATVIRLPPNRYQVLLPPDATEDVLEKLRAGATAMPPSYWDWLDLQAGVPTITEATREAFVPQMANLDLIGGLSFSKGCYPGQEIVARMHFLGNLKQRMYLAHLADTAAPASPQPGDKLYSPDLGSQASGTVVGAAPAPQGGYDLLAVMQIASAKAQSMRWKTPDGPLLELGALPYEVTENP
jgi:hypothetical protein